MVQNVLRTETALQEGAFTVLITLNWDQRKCFLSASADALKYFLQQLDT